MIVASHIETGNYPFGDLCFLLPGALARRNRDLFIIYKALENAEACVAALFRMELKCRDVTTTDTGNKFLTVVGGSQPPLLRHIFRRTVIRMDKIHFFAQVVLKQ